MAAAAIVDPTGRVLIARRPEHVHQGGLWEFPGGKLEAGEAVRDALARELYEELGITVTAARPLIRVRHSYSDKAVLLDVWRVDAFEGEPHGREGQPVAWVAPDDLVDRAFPEANLPIVSAVRLPDRYLITPAPNGSTDAFLQRLDRALAAGIRLVQLRAPGLDEAVYIDLAERARVRCRRYGARLLLNAAPEVAERVGADGVHLTSARLAALRSRPFGPDRWVAASCHDAGELERARELGCDFAVLSPVKPTASHPEAKPLGWGRFHELTDAAALPVYALGGVGPDDLDQAWRYGAQGVAAIRALWPASA